MMNLTTAIAATLLTAGTLAPAAVAGGPAVSVSFNAHAYDSYGSSYSLSYASPRHRNVHVSDSCAPRGYNRAYDRGYTRCDDRGYAPTRYRRVNRGYDAGYCPTTPRFDGRRGPGRAYDRGFDKGYNKGVKRGIKKGKRKGFDRGYDKGYDQGYEQGHASGHEHEQNRDRRGNRGR